jgi:hypothetical protein
VADTIEQVIMEVQAVCPDVDPNLARLWVRDAARRTMEAYSWSWLHKRAHLVVPAAVTNVSSGATVTVTQDSDEIVFSSAIATEAMVGSQFRLSDSLPIYEIVGYTSTTKLKIFPAWDTTTASAQGFTIFKNKFALPADCVELLSAISPTYRRKIWIGVPQEVLDENDAQRTRATGAPSVLSPCEYSPVSYGSFSSAILAIGTGPKPVASGTYTGQDDATFTIQVTTGGVGGTAVFKYKKNEGAFTVSVTSDPGGTYLSDGLLLVWPDTSTFIVNDVFTVRAKANYVAGAPRVEMYPYSTTAIVIPYWYVARHPDVTDDGVTLPGALAHRADIIREKAFEFVSAWPGTEDRPNPYNQINRRDYHAANWMQMVLELTKQDNALYQRNVLPAQRMPFAPWPFANYGNMQDYDPYSLYVDAGIY